MLVDSTWRREGCQAVRHSRSPSRDRAWAALRCPWVSAQRAAIALRSWTSPARKESRAPVGSPHPDMRPRASVRRLRGPA